MTFGRRGLEANRVPPNLRERPVATGSAGAGRRGLSPTQYWLGGLSVVALALSGVIVLQHRLGMGRGRSSNDGAELAQRAPAPAAGSSPSVPFDPASVLEAYPGVEIDYYEVDGSDPQEIRASMNARRENEANGFQPFDHNELDNLLENARRWKRRL